MLKAISPYLPDLTYEPANSLQSDGVFQLVFSNGRERILVAWASGREHEVTISAPAMKNRPMRILDTQTPDKGMTDSPQQWVCDDQRCSARLTLTEFPKIIRLSPDA